VELGDLANYIKFLIEELSYSFEEMYLDLLGSDEILNEIGSS
jgi:capsular polysaccharide biosynthesis protein